MVAGSSPVRVALALPDMIVDVVMEVCDGRGGQFSPASTKSPLREAHPLNQAGLSPEASRGLLMGAK